MKFHCNYESLHLKNNTSEKQLKRHPMDVDFWPQTLLHTRITHNKEKSQAP